MAFEPNTAGRSVFAADALLPNGWARNVLVQWDGAGRITHLTADCVAPAGVTVAKGPLLPGMPNLHSHAFQRAFVGLTEYPEKARTASGAGAI